MILAKQVFRFSKAVDPKTITPKSVFMLDEKGELVDIKIEVVEDGKKIKHPTNEPIGSWSSLYPLFE